MALSAVALTNSFWGDTVPTLVSSTYTPTSPGLLNVIFIIHSSASAVPDATGISGNPITRVERLAIEPLNIGVNKLEVFTALSTATAGAVTLALPGTPTGAFVQIVEITGAHMSAGRQGVVQIAVADVEASGTSLSVPMDTFANPANGCLVAFANTAATGSTPKTGWTELNDGTYSSPNVGFEIQWIAKNDPNPQATIGVGGFMAAIAVEIAGGPSVTPALRETLLGPSTPALLPTERLIRPAPVVVAGTITGTLATTNADDTLAAQGTPVDTGTLAKTNANDTLSAAGNSTVTGTSSTTNANDTLAATGKTAITGTLAKTNANDTSSGSGTEIITGTSSTTNNNDTMSAAGPGNPNAPVVTPPTQQVGGTLSGRRGPYTAIDAELDAILRDDEEILVLL